MKSIKVLVWLYVILLIFEGAFRKWITPGLATPLLIVRDPVVLGIYALAFARGLFPLNGFILCAFGLALASALASVMTGQDNVWVMLYGIRINYFHLPLIWVLGRVLTRDDVERIGTFLLLVAIPMTMIMVEQFRSPMNAWINKGVGSEAGGQIFGAAGRIRPPGFFSFITGPQLFFPLVTAFFLHQVSMRRRLWFPILLVVGTCIIISLPISISRGAMLSTAIVGVAFAATLPWTNKGGDFGSVRVIVLLGIVAFAVSMLPIFREGSDVFSERWEMAATGNEGDAWGSLRGRVMGGFTQPFEWMAVAPFFGHGIGVGSNVGAQLLHGTVGFFLVEDEWGKIFMELGPVLGFIFIGLRVVMTIHLGLFAARALFQDKDNLPTLIFAACAVPILLNQWGPPTILGFAVLGGGLLLASRNVPGEDDEDDDEDDGDKDADEYHSGEDEPTPTTAVHDAAPTRPERP